jgi:hypothetical protein
MTKKIFFTILVLLVAIPVISFGQKNKTQLKVKPDTISVDSVEYKLVVLDPGFESWLATKPSMDFLTQEYYERWNRLYVTEWNNRYMNQLHDGSNYETYIDYNPKINYGLDLNYRLYYYFKYFEETNHTKFYPSVK